MNHAVLDKEIEVLKSVGICFKTGMELGKDISIDSLKEQGFKAIFVAALARQGSSIDITGEDANNVISATGYLKSVYENNAPDIGKKVVVLGEGVASKMF
jgi:dihydropyrimidine dehydrogenase (NAD+) subunit PreT